jgi:glycosyltransferase involved in cell wall biosynthesis
MSNRPKICVLGRFPPPIDGQSILTEQMAKYLEDSWTVERINTSFQEEPPVQASARRSLGALTHYRNLWRPLRRIFRAMPDTPVIWPAVSPTPFGHFRDLLAILPTFQPRQKVYAVIHWGNFDQLFRSPLTRFTAPRLVRRLSGFVFNDGLDAKCAPWIPAEKRFTISNTIGEATRCTEAEVAEKQAQRVHRKSLRLLYLSNMIPSKGYLDVLQAVKLLEEEGIPVTAEFVGRWQSDDEQNAFMQYVAEHKLTEVVTAHGGVSDRMMIKQFYLNADVFLLPTYYPAEAQPLSILEAINAGIPVVTTHHAGIPNMVREHANEALFVPARSPEAIAEALRKLSDVDTWLKFSEAAVIRFRNHFSPEAVHAKWKALLSNK